MIDRIDNLTKKTRRQIYVFLRWTEKWTKTDMIYLAKGGSWLTAGQIITNIISFGLSIVFANFMSKEDFGTYKYLLYAYGLLAIIAMPGISTAVTRSISRGHDGSLLYGVKRKLIWSALASGVSMAIALFYFFSGNLPLGVGFMVISIFLPIIEPFSLYTSLLEGKKLFKQEAIADIAYNAIYAIIISLVLFFWHNLYITIICYWVIWAITRLLYFITFNKKYNLNNSIEADIHSFSNKLTVYQIFNTASLYLDKIIVFNMLGPGALATFYFAQGIPERIKALFRSLGPLSFAKYTNKTKAEIRHSITGKLTILTVGAAAVIAAYIVAAPFIFKYIFPQYSSATLISQVIAVSTIYVITYPINSILTAHKQVFKSFVISASSLIIGTILTVCLIPFYGIWGAVIGLTANRFTVIATSLYYLYRD